MLASSDDAGASFAAEQRAAALDWMHFDGSFSWLLAEDEPHLEPLDFHDGARERQMAARPRLVWAAPELGLSIPYALWTFLERPDIQRRVPTSCSNYLCLSERLLQPPAGEGRLLRFRPSLLENTIWFRQRPDQ